MALDKEWKALERLRERAAGGNAADEDCNILNNALRRFEAKLSKMEGLEIQISDGDVWLIFPNAAISIESICKLGLPGPIVRRNIRAWRDKAIAGGEEA